MCSGVVCVFATGGRSIPGVLAREGYLVGLCVARLAAHVVVVLRAVVKALRLFVLRHGDATLFGRIGARIAAGIVNRCCVLTGIVSVLSLGHAAALGRQRSHHKHRRKQYGCRKQDSAEKTPPTLVFDIN